MRAIIPVAGKGTRLQPHTFTTPKVLLHVAGKPMLGHLLDELEALKVDRVTLIIGYLGDQVVEYVEKNYSFEAEFIEQPEMLGLGHAISLAASTQRDDEPGLIILGDTIFDANLGPILGGGRSSLGVKEVEDARRFGVIEHNGEGRITRLVEKAPEPPSNLALVGIYFINDMPLLFDSLDYIVDNEIKTAGEFQLTDALQRMIDEGHDFGYFEIDGWLDCGKRETILQTNRDLLDLKESLRAKEGDNIKSSILRQPVAIHPEATVENSIVGPYVSVGAGCKISGSVVRDTIMATGVEVQDANLDESILSDGARVTSTPLSLDLGAQSYKRLKE